MTIFNRDSDSPHSPYFTMSSGAFRAPAKPPLGVASEGCCRSRLWLMVDYPAATLAGDNHDE